MSSRSSRANVLDSIPLEHHSFDTPVVVLCRDDRVIEIYVVDESELQLFAGQFNHHLKIEPQKITAIYEAIVRRIKEDPVSKRALAWLSALNYNGLL